MPGSTWYEERPGEWENPNCPGYIILRVYGDYAGYWIWFEDSDLGHAQTFAKATSVVAKHMEGGNDEGS